MKVFVLCYATGEVARVFASREGAIEYMRATTVDKEIYEDNHGGFWEDKADCEEWGDSKTRLPTWALDAYEVIL